MSQPDGELKLYCPWCGTQLAVYRAHDTALCCGCRRQYTKLEILKNPARFRPGDDVDVPAIVEVKDAGRPAQ